MAAARLSQLCRKTRALSADVLRLVHAYLVVHVGIRCPVWLGQMLQQKVLGNPFRGAVYRHARLLFRVCHWIDYDIYRVDFQGSSTSERTALRGHPVQLDVHIWSRQDMDGIYWRLTCRQGDNLLRSCDGRWLSDFTDELNGIRSCYTETEPRGCAEVPVTWSDWRGYIRLWLFGPRAQQPQGLMTGCRECGNTCMAIRLHGETFCSQECADSFVVLSYRCWSCRAPLNTGQKMCRSCPDGQAALQRERRNSAVIGRCWGCRAPLNTAQQECLDCPEENAARGA